MRDISIELQARLSERATSLCRLWAIYRSDGSVLRFTDSVRPVEFEDEVYRSDISFTSSSIFTSRSFASQQNVSITTVLHDDGVREDDVRRRLYDGGQGIITVIDYLFPEYGGMTLFEGSVGSIRITDKKNCQIDLIPNSSVANGRQIGAEVYSRTCRASLGDAACKFNISAGKKAFSVITASGGSVVTDTLDEANNVWVLGFVKWLTGDNAGTISRVQSTDSSSKSLFLLAAPFKPIQPDDTGEVYQGCDKLVNTCRDKFNNVLNFQGEPAIPDGVIPGSTYYVTGAQALPGV